MTEQELKQLLILPRDPVAYPIYPKRPAMARRPVFQVVKEKDEVSNAG